MANQLAASFHIDAFLLGSLSAFFYYAYVSMQIPVGVLVDRFGPHRLLTVMAVLCAIAAYIFSLAQNLAVAEMARLLIGFSASFAFVGALKLASLWFPPNRFGLLAGFTQAIGMFGAAIGDAPMSLVVEKIGWRDTMQLIALAFFILAILIGLIVRDQPKRSTAPLGRKKTEPILQYLKCVLSNKQSWINAGFAAVVYAPTASLAELWGPKFLAAKYHVSLTLGASMNSFIFIGWAIAGPLAGFYSDRLGRRKPLMIISALCCAVILAAILYVPNLPMSLCYLLLFLFGVANTGVGVSYALSTEINPHRLSGTSLAFCNMASVIFGALLQPIMGKILDLNWTGHFMHGARIYNNYAYQVAFTVLPIGCLIGVVLAIWVKESYCKHQPD